MIEIWDWAMLKNENELDLSGCLALPQWRVVLSLVELFCVANFAMQNRCCVANHEQCVAKCDAIPLNSCLAHGIGVKCRCPLAVTRACLSSDEDGRAAAVPWRHGAAEGEAAARDGLHRPLRRHHLRRQDQDQPLCAQQPARQARRHRQVTTSLPPSHTGGRWYEAS